MDDKNIFVFQGIRNLKETVEFTAIETRNGFKIAGLAFKQGHTLAVEVWDAPSYIFEQLFPMLLRWKYRMLTIEDKDTFDIELKMTDEEILDLIDVISEAKERGWDKL